jgi:hypothetical protein
MGAASFRAHSKAGEVIMTRLRTIGLHAGCTAALLFIILGASTALAYPMYDDDPGPGVGTGCGQLTCHTGFQGGNGALHTQHRLHFGISNCNACHPSGGGTTPVRTYWSGPGGGLGCAGCHGQDYGETSPNSGEPKATAYGLRQFHVNNGVPTCGVAGGCHVPGQLGHPNPFPPLFPEHVLPPYYGTALTSLTDPCSSAEEDLSVDGDSVGLDNDGDGFADYPADSDCGPPTTTTTLPPITNGITGLKLILVDKYTSSAKAKVVFVSKDTVPGAIHKGVESDPPALTGTVEIFDKGDPTNLAVYDLAGANWIVNKSTVAKYVFKTAAPGAEGVKVVVVKPDLLLKVVGKNLGDGDAATGSQSATDLDLASLSPGSALRVRVTIANATDGSTHVMCSDFSVDTAASIAAGTGYKIVSKTSTAPMDCP